MKLIVGLGNPGLEYERTRHNAGFLVLDELARRHCPGELARSRFHGAVLEGRLGAAGRAALVKPTTYMNRSGQTVAEAARFFKLEVSTDVLVVLDDVALPVGAIRVRASGSDGGHNGLKDIDRALGFAGVKEAAYARLRVGVGATPPQMVLADWVLSRFRPDEQGELERAVRQAADAAEVWAAEGAGPAMNRFNKKVGEAERA